MIINYIENKNGFWIFSKDKINLVTSEGEASVPGQLPESIIRELNEKLKNFSLESKEDFIKLKEICKENYKTIEECVIKISKKLWFLLNKEANMIPRPMALVLKKDSGIRAFYVLSLNCNDYSQAMFVNEKIFELLNQKLNESGLKIDEAGFYHDLDDKKVLEALQDSIKQASEGITFSVRICVNIKNSKGENNRDNMLEYMTNLVFNDNILVAIDPINFSDVNTYTKLKEKVVGDCYIAVDNVEHFTDKQADFSYIRQDDLVNVINTAKKSKEKNFNVIFDGDADVCVGLSFPILKIDLTNKKYSVNSNRVHQILEEIREYRASLKKENLNENLISEKNTVK